MKMAEVKGSGTLTDASQMNAVLNEAHLAFKNPFVPWGQYQDERLLAHLNGMRVASTSLHKTCIEPLLIERADNLAQRAEEAVTPWITAESLLSKEAAAHENPFVRGWLRALHAFRAAFVTCTNTYKDAHASKDAAAINASRASAQALLMLWEEGTVRCPPLAQQIRERSDLLLLPSSGETASQKMYEEFRWHTVRWAIILAKISQNDGSDRRWSAELATERMARPARSAGMGPLTLTHVYERYGFTSGILSEVSVAAYRNYDEDDLH